MEEPLVQFDHFGFRYNAQTEPTLYDISFSVRKGEKVLICGPSGCGKSTVANSINGLIPFSYRGDMAGNVRIKGRETRELGLFGISRTVGTVLQDTDAQFVGMTVAEDIAFALENDCVATPEMKQRVREVADAVSVDGHLSHAPNELSGGQKQRVSMAGVMVDEVELFLFDEPLANLDPATGKAAIEMIDEITKRTGAAAVIIEHRLEDVLWRAVDRIILMGDGRILADTTPDELLSSSALADSGVREPLYLTALKYAGVKITPEMHPWSIDTVRLSDADAVLVREWFDRNAEPHAGSDAAPILEARDVSFRYDSGQQALRNIDLKVRTGEILAIVGTNGAGKSTFSKLICGFETPQRGQILFEGEDFAPYSIKERADRVGYVMQNPNQMISKVMIRDEVALGLVTRGVPDGEITARVEKALKVCGLYPFRNWPISALSYGQKKRVTIASILVLEPKLIILDEPTAGQDYRHYTEIMEFLTRLNREGITVVLITHDMHLMLEYAERTAVFHDGRLLGIDTGANVLTDPETVKKASLKETSLYALAKKCGIEDASGFVQCFIDKERSSRV